MKINFHIDHVVFDGVALSTNQLAVLKESMRNEVVNLLGDKSTQGNLMSEMVVTNMVSRNIYLTDTNTVKTGRDIAQSIVGRIAHD